MFEGLRKYVLNAAGPLHCLYYFPTPFALPRAVQVLKLHWTLVSASPEWSSRNIKLKGDEVGTVIRKPLTSGT